MIKYCYIICRRLLPQPTGGIHMYSEILKRLAGFVIFDNLKKAPAIEALTEYFKAYPHDAEAAAEHYSDFVREIISGGGDFSEYLYRLLIFDDNIFVRLYLKGQSEILEAQLKYELGTVSKLISSLPDEPISGLTYPKITVSRIDLTDEYLKALPDIYRRGVGIFSRSYMFRISNSGDFIPVKCHGISGLTDLIGYERERSRILNNTKALLDGKRAANILLYGDAGTGKSTTVKAITRELAPGGLRLIQLEHDQVSMLPSVLERISDEPLKFIIFIDDLTVLPGSEELGTLKTVLEGGAGTDRSNSVVYVTSNHRQLVKENISDRSDELHSRDNMQGVSGLSARFGLTVTFLAPDKRLYLEIVEGLAKKHGIPITDGLLTDAEAYAVRRGGQTPRCAKQFIELTASGINPVR